MLFEERMAMDIIKAVNGMDFMVFLFWKLLYCCFI